jgi:S-adenosylmethionine decarboxylase
MDGHVKNAERLQPAALYAMFDQLVAALEMEYLQTPLSFKVPVDPRKLDSEEDEGGWSVFAQITTSHIAVHCWPLRKAFMMDVFSCKPFNSEKARDVIEQSLGVASSRIRVLERTEPDT